jgi:NTP pyrophosphatase (non-canonical NTP hydrolase)
VWRMQEAIGAFDKERFTSLGPGYLALNIAGEAGELAGVVKKLWRTEPSIGQPGGFAAVGAEARDLIGDELADVVILCAVLSNHLGIDIEAEVSKKLDMIEQRLQAGYYGHEAHPQE